MLVAKDRVLGNAAVYTKLFYSNQCVIRPMSYWYCKAALNQTVWCSNSAAHESKQLRYILDVSPGSQISLLVIFSRLTVAVSELELLGIRLGFVCFACCS